MQPARRRPYAGRMARLGADDVAVDELATTFDRTAARLVAFALP